MPTTLSQVETAIDAFGLARRPVCVHASFRSFGGLDGGPDALINAFLDRGCTIMALCLSYAFASPPPPGRRPRRNGVDYGRYAGMALSQGPVYDPSSNELNEAMVGAVPKALLSREGRSRGDHPRSSFVAVGPRARYLVEPQGGLDVFAPLRRLVDLGGAVVLMGVGLDKATLLHLAEQEAGREPFRRWANGPEGVPIEVQEGGCSSGFPNLGPALEPLAKRGLVGESPWTCLDAQAALGAAVAAIRAVPDLTRCPDPSCLECADAVEGGPNEL